MTVSMSTNDPLWVKFNDQKAVMALRSIQDRCVFLNDETNLCTIYEHRPVTCRDHPFNVTFSETGAVEKISLSKLSSAPRMGRQHFTPRGFWSTVNLERGARRTLFEEGSQNGTSARRD